MAWIGRAGEYECLQRQIEGNEYKALLRQLQWDEPALRSFNNWVEVAEHFQRLRTGQEQDLILGPLLRLNEVDGNHRCRNLLLVFLWPSLNVLHRRRRSWDADREELWLGIMWAFLRAVSNFSTARRPERFARKLLNDTSHFLHDEYRARWERADRERPAGDDDLSHEPVEPELASWGLEMRELSEGCREALRPSPEADRDALLVIWTRVHEVDLEAAAERLGLTYEAAKKRRQRAEAALREWLQFSSDGCPLESPRRASSGRGGRHV